MNVFNACVRRMLSHHSQHVTYSCVERRIIRLAKKRSRGQFLLVQYHRQNVAGAKSIFEKFRRAATRYSAFHHDGNPIAKQVRLIHVVGSKQNGAKLLLKIEMSNKSYVNLKELFQNAQTEEWKMNQK